MWCLFVVVVCLFVTKMLYIFFLCSFPNREMSFLANDRPLIEVQNKNRQQRVHAMRSDAIVIRAEWKCTFVVTCIDRNGKKTCHWLAWRQSHAIYKSKIIATHTRSGRRIISIDHEQEKLNVVNCCVCQVRIDRADNFCYFIAVSMRCPVECKSLPLLWQSHVVWFGWHRSVNLLYGERDFIGVAVAMVSAASGSRSLSKRQFDQRPSTFQSFRMRTAHSPYRYLYIYNNNACITRSGSNFKTIRKLMSEIINQNSQ